MTRWLTADWGEDLRRQIRRFAIIVISGLAFVQALAFVPTRTSADGPAWPGASLSATADSLKSKVASLARIFSAPPFTTYVVTTAADNLDNNNPTPGSLRAAIRDANLNPGADVIEFAIPGAGPHTLGVGAGLPVITDTLTIDGYSQPGAGENTLATGCDAVLKIEIRDQTLSQGIAFVIGASDCVVQGLVIHGFNTAILIDGSRTNAGASGNVVRGNFIGTTPAGTAVSADYQFSAAGNLGGGIMIDSGGFKPDGSRGAANNNTVGGTSPAARNVISGNGSFGVRISQNIGTATGNLVQGNLIGTQADGVSSLGNLNFGVSVGGAGNLIGGRAARATSLPLAKLSAPSTSALPSSSRAARPTPPSSATRSIPTRVWASIWGATG